MARAQGWAAGLAGGAAAGAAAVCLGAAAARRFGLGLGPQRCRACLGTGYLVCTACGGRGKQGLRGSAEPLRRCGVCTGSGVTRCEGCSATGISNHWLYQPAEDPGWGPRGEE